MNRIAPLTVVVAALCALVPAAQAAPKARIVEFGVYSTDPVANPPVGTPIGRYQLLKKTRKIPLKVGVRFGFCAEIEGIEMEGRYTLTEIVRHPLTTQPNGIESAGWNVPRMLNVVEGKGVWCGSHVFKEAWELVPGKWRFTVGDGDGDIIIEEFETVKAP